MGEIITIKGDTVDHFENIEMASMELGLTTMDIVNAILSGCTVNGYSFVMS